MKHRIGYACINTSINATTNKTCRLDKCTPDRLRELIRNNLDGLKEVLSWNKAHNIYLYRISSVIIPFASHPVNNIPWWVENKDQFDEIGSLIREYDMRVSMHPGQYVNINSPNPEVLESSFKDLEWHARFLETLGVDNTNRLVLHAGGVYDNKQEAMSRFINAYKNLPENIRARFSLENDDKSYTIWDVLEINDKTKVPIVFDNLHHNVKNTNRKADEDIDSILKLCFSTWTNETGIPKIHFSTQKYGERPGAHANNINMDDFIEFYINFKNYDFDIMFETKDKEKSVLEAFKRLQLEAAKGINF